MADAAAILPEAVAKAAGQQPKVGFTVGPAAVRKRVSLAVGKPDELGQWLRLPVRWSARPGAALFPVLDGYIQLEPLSARESKLSLRANYEPPLGRFGKAIDDAALHGVAKATIADFVAEVRAQVMQAARDAAAKEA